jgi:hypothetical protein
LYCSSHTDPHNCHFGEPDLQHIHNFFCELVYLIMMNTYNLYLDLTETSNVIFIFLNKVNVTRETFVWGPVQSMQEQYSISPKGSSCIWAIFAWTTRKTA